MRIALAQINTTIGDFAGNIRKISHFTRSAKQNHADLCVFPEQSITGYPAHDLLERTRFIDQNLSALEMIKKDTSGIAIIVGFAERHQEKAGKGLYNSAALIYDGKIQSIHRKCLLPTYDVFDESRYFDPAPAVNTVDFKGIKLGITICEDVWNDPDFWKKRIYPYNPAEELVNQGAQIILNLAASPFTLSKRHIRVDMFHSLVKHYKTAFLFANSVGGNDDLVFDGSSMGVTRDGDIINTAREFKEDIIYFETVDKNGRIDIRTDEETTSTTQIKSDGDIQAALNALILGTRDYGQKCGFSKGLVGLSGGIDSALVAYIGAKAFGVENVHALLMPSPYSSRGSIVDSENLAKNLGISYDIISIEKILDRFLDSLEEPLNLENGGVTEENLQARIRGNLLMAFSNRNGNLLLSTGNKSELATGYCTLYGDMAGGLAVISDVPKTMVYKICKHINREQEIIPQQIIDKPPSAELRPNQKDTDSLPPYDRLDAILEAHIVQGADYPGLVEMGFEPELVEQILNLVRINEYKRRQAPPGLKITTKAFGFGRRIPIAQRWIP